MLGDQGDIRAIRVICGENGSEDLATKNMRRQKSRSSGINRSSPLTGAYLEPRSAHGTHGIHGMLNPEDWPQRGAEGTKAEAGGLTANLR
jgi:hypothetical protein